jgi:diguanylate cyclase (GGDEF)-like protein
MSVLYMDLDGFKGVNDRFGHETGNIVLKQVATMLSQRVRLCDVFGRAGGDEFVVMLPRTEQKEAYVLAERLREAVEDYRLQIDNEQAVDCVRLSVGVAGFPADGRSIKEVVRAADDAVYAAKAKGGNRVCIAGEESVEEPEPGQEVLSGGRTRVDGRTEV